MSTVDDLAWIKNRMGIDVSTTTKEEAANILRQEKINTTSWVLSSLAKEYGDDWAEEYRQSISDTTCTHGFISDCPYCRWGTD